MAYGLLDRALEIEPYRLELAEEEDWLYYSRITTESGTVEARVRMPRSLKEHLVLAPLPPLLQPERGLYKHAMVKLREPVVVPSKSSASLELYVSTDLGVLVSGGASPRLIDVFSVEKPKMAVYGSVREGLLARYLVENTPGPGRMLVKITVYNEADKPVTLTRIVVPATWLSPCYREGSWEAVAPNLRMLVKSENLASVRTSGEECPRGFGRVYLEDLHLQRTPSLELTRGFDMLWGY